jgi:probable rRNA maturation factor
MSADTILEDERWQKYSLEERAERCTGATLTHFGLDPDRFEISVLGCNDARIMSLNADFRDKDSATNVLSWPSQERGAARPGETPDLPTAPGSGPPEELGDIAISFETCEREAHDAGRDMGFHVSHLLVHATLHLLGYDHIFPEDAALMEGIERQILATMGLPDPYGDD